MNSSQTRSQEGSTKRTHTSTVDRRRKREEVISFLYNLLNSPIILVGFMYLNISETNSDRISVLYKCCSHINIFSIYMKKLIKLLKRNILCWCHRCLGTLHFYTYVYKVAELGEDWKSETQRERGYYYISSYIFGNLFWHVCPTRQIEFNIKFTVEQRDKDENWLRDTMKDQQKPRHCTHTTFHIHHHPLFASISLALRE